MNYLNFAVLFWKFRNLTIKASIIEHLENLLFGIYALTQDMGMEALL